MGAVPDRKAMGNSPGGLQRQRQCLGLLHSPPGALPRLLPSRLRRHGEVSGQSLPEDYILFYEFHGDNGAGIGASHETGWTGTVANLIQLGGALSSGSVISGKARFAYH